MRPATAAQGTSPRRPSRHARSPQRREPRESQEESTSTSPEASPGDWDFDRGRSRVRKPNDPLSEENLRRRGYHSLLSSFGKVFHVEKRWKLIREMGSGAYGVVISAADEISGETVAIKQVTRIFDKIQLAKRALREITLLRHFNHENITGLIDLDAISPTFNEIYIFMEPMEADLHQIIRSGQALTNEHVQYFLYQILRGMKYIHSAGVVHRDLKPGNLLVNADCELKICDFGLSRGFDQRPDEYATQMTEYVATRWYRAPEIMLAFRRYNTAIDVWSVGCIFAELLTGKTLFKGKDYVDQLNKILNILGTPSEDVIKRIGSDKAQAYVRGLPISKRQSFQKLVPTADAEALDLLEKMLSFDPSDRLTIQGALEQPWLASYHDVNDEPECPVKFERWRQVEELETIEQFREAIWTEIQDYRREARWAGTSPSYGTSRNTSLSTSPVVASSLSRAAYPGDTQTQLPDVPEGDRETEEGAETTPPLMEPAEIIAETKAPPEDPDSAVADSAIVVDEPVAPFDPVLTYARRSSFFRTSTNYATYSPGYRGHRPIPSFSEGPSTPQPASTATTAGGVPFPSATDSFVMPARTRTMSYMGSEVSRRLLRTLSTVSIHESGEGLPGGLAQVAPIGKFITEPTTSEAPASSIPDEFAVDRDSEGSEDDGDEGKKVAGTTKSKGKGKKGFRLGD